MASEEGHVGDLFIAGETEDKEGSPKVAPPRVKILAADDEPAIVRVYARFLTRPLDIAPQDFLTAYNLASACAVFDEQEPFLRAILSDMRMPKDGDGIAFYRYVRKKNRHLPMAIISGGMEKEDREELDRILIEDSRCAFFNKPLSNQNLIDWLKSQI